MKLLNHLTLLIIAVICVAIEFDIDSIYFTLSDYHCSYKPANSGRSDSSFCQTSISDKLQCEGEIYSFYLFSRWIKYPRLTVMEARKTKSVKLSGHFFKCSRVSYGC